jgi:exopolysaccharide biosynthesis predicted pyruvyltransferase EpsI
MPATQMDARIDLKSTSNGHLQGLCDGAASVLAQLFAGHRECAVLDYPDHPNVGDSAIWVGERLALQRLGVRLRFVGSLRTFVESDFRRQIPAGTLVLIHGGGNFGTVWPHHQGHREELFSRLRDFKLVQLPQTIHFDDPVALQRNRDLVQQHPNLTILCRDAPSLALAQQGLGAHAALCTDSAMFLVGSLPRNDPVVDCLVLARTDKEAAIGDVRAQLAASGLSYEVVDWLDEPESATRQLTGWVRRRARGQLGATPGYQPTLTWLWDRLAWQRVRRGCKLLSRGRVVITDRLHAHILSTLLGIPNIVLDNNYGKVSAFMRSWTDDNPLCHRVTTILQALAAARSQLKRPDLDDV